jgi:hypothetical protein
MWRAPYLGGGDVAIRVRRRALPPRRPPIAASNFPLHGLDGVEDTMVWRLSALVLRCGTHPGGIVNDDRVPRPRRCGGLAG